MDTSTGLALNQTTWNQPSQSAALGWPPAEMDARILSDGSGSQEAGRSPPIEPPSMPGMNETGSASAFSSPILPSIAQPAVVSANKLSTAMIIALTIAIVVPPALLVGAILGYLAAP